jgi:hypothetical protein
VAHFGEKANELMGAYQKEVTDHKALSYDDVEGIWEEEIRPRLKDFASMQNPEEAPPEDSRWFGNWRVPEGRIL